MDFIGRFTPKTLTAAVALAVSAIAGHAQAAGLGRLTVQSALGQPLRAEVEITSLSKEEAASLTARLAPPEAFKQAGLEFNPALTGLSFAIGQRADGRPVVKVSSTRSVNEPFIDLLVELNWATGKFVREYTFLLDPPELRLARPSGTDSAAPAVVAPAVQSPAAQVTPTPAAPAPAAAPARPAAPAPETRMAEAKSDVKAEPVPAARPQRATRPAPVAEAPKQAPIAAPAAPAASKADKSADGAAAEGSVTTKRGDTLAGIASRAKPASVSLEQAIIAIYRANPDAFFGSINRMRADVSLNIPDAAVMGAVDANEARNEVRSGADFQGYRSRLAASSRKLAQAKTGQRAAGEVAPADAGKAAPAAPRDELKLSKGAPGAKGVAGSAGSKTAPAEAAVARDNALKESNSRVADLQKNVKDLEALLELKNKRLAEVEKQLADAKAAGKTAAGAVTPPPAAASKADAPKADAGKAPAVAKLEPPKMEPPKVEPPKADAGKAPAAAKLEPPKMEPPKVEPPKADAAKAGTAPKVDAPKAEAPKIDAPKVDAPKAEAPKLDVPKLEAPKPDAPKADASKPDAAKADATGSAAATDAKSVTPPVVPAPGSATAGATGPDAAKPAGAAKSPEAAKAAAAKTPPVVPAQTPAAQPEEGILDMVTENPLIPGGVIALLGLGGAFAWWRRRKKAAGDEKFEDSLDGSEEFSANSLFGTTGGQQVDTNSLAGNAANTALQAAQTSLSGPASTEVDPIAEAEVYIAYGREAQAEEILKEALKRQPERQAIRSKLLEIYAGRKEVAAFSALAQEMHDMTGGQNEEWPKVLTQGLALDPGNPLFSGDGPKSVVSSSPLSVGGALTATLAASGTDVGAARESADDHGVSLEANTDVPAMDFDLTIDSGMGAGSMSLQKDTTVGLAGQRLSNTTGEARSGASELSKTLEGKIELPSLDLDDKPEPVSKPEPDAVADLEDFKLDLPALETLKGPSAAMMPEDAQDLSPIGLDLSPSTLMGNVGGDSARWQEMATKLDLASAYQDIGDKDGARELLDEVIRGGDTAQQQKARAMLSKIS